MYKQLILSDDELKRRYITGESATSLAKECNVTCGTILRKLERLKIPVKRKISSLCLILETHKQKLKNDPNRLSGKFILKLSQKEGWE